MLDPRGRRFAQGSSTTNVTNGGLPAIITDMGARERFEALYTANASRVQGYLMRRTDSATADELLAEVFAICWRRIEEVPSDPLPWLFEVSRRVLSTQRRGARRRAALQARLRAITPDRSDDPAAVTRESPLRSALEQLSDADRELLTLVAWDGLSPAQAASALGVKPGTLRVRLARARARLAKQLERDEPTPTLRQRPMETP